jgi:hypothetical protein
MMWLRKRSHVVRRLTGEPFPRLPTSFEGVTSHYFPKTVATLMDEAGYRAVGRSPTWARKP